MSNNWAMDTASYDLGQNGRHDIGGKSATSAIGYRENLPVDAPKSLISCDLPLPELGSHDLLVEVEAVSVNPVDVKLRANAPATGPGAVDGFRVLGFDAAGTVVRAGDEVTLFSSGDRVFYAGSIDRPGTNRRLHAVDERIVGKMPASLSFADAASLPLTAITAWESLFDRLELTSESEGVLLVVGATGGVGSIMLQLAEELLPKVTVIATASDPERARWARELGAEYTVNHREDLTEQVSRIAPGGVQWLFTAHSEGQIPTYAQIVAPFGHIVAIDDGARDVEPLKSACIAWHWEFMFARPRLADSTAQHELLGRIADLVDSGRLRPTVTKELSPVNPENLREAHRLVESGRTLGKIVLAGWV